MTTQWCLWRPDEAGRERLIIHTPGWTNCRRVVVIDPESLPMDDLLRALDRWHTWTPLVHERVAIKALFDTIAEQAAPVRPDEPTGPIGMVRDDRDGVAWTYDGEQWCHKGNSLTWDEFWTCYGPIAGVTE